MNLGTLIRRHRKEQKLTLKTVAEKTQVSEGFLSQVENNVNSPSVETLIRICNSIGINADDLLNQVEQQEKLVVIPRSEWEDLDVPHSGFVTLRFFSPENRIGLDSAILILEPGKTIPVRKGVKNGQELLCLLNGSLQLTHGERVIEMQEGDSVHLWTNIKKQEIVNTGSKRAIALWVSTL